MANLRIRNEAPVHGSRCNTCIHAHIIVGYRETETMVYCTYMNDPIVVPFKVRECSNYGDKNRPTWDQMEELALPLKPATARQSPGFKVTTVLVGAAPENE